MVGGGASPQPGQISLSHHGVLFLDEFPEFTRQSIESLRQPLEDSIVTISRANYTLSFPASFLLAVCMNPCPCGYYFDKNINCTCSLHDLKRYKQKVSGPILDRIDI